MNSPYLVIDRSGNAVDINRRIDTMYNDPWNQKKAEVLELYLQGKSPAIISDLTGVPRIRIERELNRLTEHNMEEAMQANTGAKDEAFIYIRGENITEALDDIIIRRKSC